MTENPFDRLAPFIREFIYAHRWDELRAVQVEACRVIFGTDAHLLLATGTASGKTEAAFMPVLTLLHEDPSPTVAVLYIGPTKALINDQFVRLNDLLREADIPCWHWHGDVSQSEKAKLIKAPRGVLQITPESLESLLINKTTELGRLFGDLRFMIIDEVHVFMGSDRGRQILCQLARLARYVRGEPRRIGLSATLGDYSLAEAWLCSGSGKSVVTPPLGGGVRRVRLAVEHFQIDAKPAVDRQEDAPEQGDESEGEAVARSSEDAYYQYLFQASAARKCVIFANSRGETESIVANLRQIAQRARQPDIYHVHHGSISAPLREAAEEAMRNPDAPAVTAATVTMELGIDIGQLERVLQVQAPSSVTSFVQRLGRSGRRGGPAEMWMVCREDTPDARDPLPEQIPWTLLQAIAIIQLYVEEKWIEPIQPIHLPFSLLYHQTMSTLAALGELSPQALAQRVLTLPPFAAVTPDDFRSLLHHLVSIDHIQQTEERGLIIGLTGERVVRNFRFYAVFPDNEEYAVREESREIGSIAMAPPPGERFGLAGRTWEVVEIDEKRRLIWAKPVGGKVPACWTGDGPNIHSRILERMRDVLLEDTVYPYLQSRARERLASARALVRSAGLMRRNILSLGGNALCIFPWMGSIAFGTLVRALHHTQDDPGEGLRPGGKAPYFLTVQMASSDPDALSKQLRALCDTPLVADDLVGADEAPKLAKYDEFVPPDLLRKALASDWLDVAEMKRSIAAWR